MHVGVCFAACVFHSHFHATTKTGESIMDIKITDLLILAKKERAPAHFTVVSTLHTP